MPFELQATLLRVLQEKEVIRVGGHKPIPIDVRIIAATNKNLNQEIAYNGSFRSDLFYRLNVFTIELVPLRERLQDVAELSSYYIHELSLDNGVPVKEISPEALKVLTQYKWQGNIRELNNVMERAFYLSDRSAYITVEHLPHILCIICRTNFLINEFGRNLSKPGTYQGNQAKRKRPRTEFLYPGLDPKKRKYQPDRQRAGHLPNNPLSKTG